MKTIEPNLFFALIEGKPRGDKALSALIGPQLASGDTVAILIFHIS